MAKHWYYYENGDSLLKKGEPKVSKKGEPKVSKNNKKNKKKNPKGNMCHLDCIEKQDKRDETYLGEKQENQ